MNVSEFVIKYLKARGVSHFFGYQGTMITYFVDAICKESGANNHSFYNEQGAAFAACGFAKSSGCLSCAYATSGPGAINLIQGIADAYYDSTPVVFITGQLNRSEYSSIKTLRQQGFQETNIIHITKTITKYGHFIDTPEEIAQVLPEAVKIALSGRRGPVLLDVPMDIQRSVVGVAESELYNIINQSPAISALNDKANVIAAANEIVDEIEKSDRPVFIIGNGIHREKSSRDILARVVRNFGIPVLSSLMAKDMISEDTGLYFGFIGASYGQRSGNIIANKKADLIISLGCRLSTRLTGTNQKIFAKDAKIVRIEIDSSEILRKIHDDEKAYILDVNELLKELLKRSVHKSFKKWIDICNDIKSTTDSFDDTCDSRYPNKYIESVSEAFKQPLITVADVGQNMMWVANSFRLHLGQELLFSGAHGAMGFALPASIGAYHATGKPILCFSGDGGFQMNIQELQYVFREKLPIKIFVLNNNSLGMITQVQDDYLEGRRTGTDSSGGFTSPDFAAIADAYGIKSYTAENLEMFNAILKNIDSMNDEPVLVQVRFNEKTYSHPKTYFGEEISNQRPYLPKEMYSRIMNL